MRLRVACSARSPADRTARGGTRSDRRTCGAAANAPNRDRRANTGRLTARIPAYLPIDKIAVTHVQHPMLVRLNRRIQDLSHPISVLRPIRVFSIRETLPEHASVGGVRVAAARHRHPAARARRHPRVARSRSRRAGDIGRRAHDPRRRGPAAARARVDAGMRPTAPTPSRSRASACGVELLLSGVGVRA